jgi:hypothetical protein
MDIKKLVKVGKARQAAWERVTKAKGAAIAANFAWDNARRDHYLDLIDAECKVRVVEITSDARLAMSRSGEFVQSQAAYYGVVEKAYRGRKHFGVVWVTPTGDRMIQTIGDLERGCECRVHGIPYPSARLEDYCAVKSST